MKIYKKRCLIYEWLNLVYQVSTNFLNMLPYLIVVSVHLVEVEICSWMIGVYKNNIFN
jgi:hypothetical protein